jgi:hypothetical protein
MTTGPVALLLAFRVNVLSTTGIRNRDHMKEWKENTDSSRAERKVRNRIFR